jgi:hypothetical protein
MPGSAKVRHVSGAFLGWKSSAVGLKVAPFGDTPIMKHAVSHDLGQEKAKQVAQAAFESYRERYAHYDPKATWVNDRRAEITFSVKGISLNDIEMELDVPFLLRPFKGKALSVIEEEIKRWIAKAKAGEI